MIQVTLQDIARLCGVSKSTVSHALSGDPRVRASTRERIQAAADKLGYNPANHQTARRLALRKYGHRLINRVVALVSTASNHQANYYILQSLGVMDVLGEAGYALLHVPAQGATDHPAAFPPIFASGEVDGAILTSGSRIELYQLRNTPGFDDRPVISLVQAMEGCSAILADDASGAYQATAHLLDLGHRYLVHFFDESWGDIFARRIAGIHQAFRDRGMDPLRHAVRSPVAVLGAISPPYHLDLDYLYQEPSASRYALEQQRYLVQWLREHRHYTALLAQNDAQARRIWYLLTGAGFRVPEEISVVGFDDTDALLDAHGKNQLTTVHVPLREVGQEGARLLIRRITGEEPVDRQIILPASLTIRGSTAPPGR